VLDGLPALLAPGGVAVLELGQGQRQAVAGLAEARDFSVHACREDLGGVKRALVVGWLGAKKPFGAPARRD
jgi:release factor glutamine methyltransferase